MRVVIDVGGTKTLLVAVDGAGKELGQLKFPTEPEYQKFIDNLIDQLHKWSTKLSQPIQGIAIAMPGVIDYDSMHVLSFGNLDWHDIDIYHQLADEFHVPITLDNDANFGALGEARRGSGRGYKTMLYITISTGIGTGVTVNGKIDPALAKSEGGHMHFRHDGKLVDWESFASGKAFYEKYGKLGKDTPADDPSWKQWTEEVSLGIGSLMAIIQPDVIVIGGSMGEHFEKYKNHLLDALHATKSEMVQMPEIVAAEAPHKAVINGGIEAINDSVSH